MSPQNLTAGPDFASWKPENLAKFAQESYVKMQEQSEQIEQLRLDLRAAMEAYRALLRR